MMKKINKTVKEIVENNELRKRAEQFEESEYEDPQENIEESYNDDSKNINEDEQYDEDYEDEQEKIVQSHPDPKTSTIPKDGTAKSSSRFSRDQEATEQIKHHKGGNDSDDYEDNFDRESPLHDKDSRAHKNENHSQSVVSDSKSLSFIFFQNVSTMI